jgi:glycerophosphoryl diester phosphodiesterase
MLTRTMDQARNLFTSAVCDFGKTWRALLATDALYKILAFALLVPLAGLAIRAMVFTSGDPALADTDILFFFLSPLGLVALIALSALILTIVALEQACLMSIGLGAVEGKLVGLWDALVYGARQAGRVVTLTMWVAGTVLLIAAPFLVAGGLVYHALLTEFDINYYLSETPRAFWIAAPVIGLIGIVLAIVLLRVLTGWALALPILLFEGAPARQALSLSEERVRGSRWTVGVTLGGWFLGTIVLSTLALGVVSVIGRLVVSVLSGSVSLLVLAAGVLLVVWGAVNLIVTLITAGVFALLVVRLYGLLDEGAVRRTSDPWASVTSAAGKAWRVPKKALPVVLVLLAVAAGLATKALLNEVRRDRVFLVTAHRGAAGAAPENTLASVKRAIADGTDFVEIDVQETADGEVVVIHDRDLMKVGGTNLPIHASTYEQLHAVDIGSWFGPEFEAERLPKLAQVLELCKGKARVDIELKYYGFDQRLEERVVEIVEAAGMESEIIVMSLKYDGIQKIRALRPDWTYGLLTATALGDLTRVDADFLAVHAGLATPGFVRRAHRRGKQVFVWTVNDPVEMWKMMNRGVDSLITDEPALARAVLNQRAAMNAVERLMVELSFWFGAESEQPGPETDAS